MSDSRTIEIFVADCPVCSGIVDTVRDMACPSCEVHVVSLHDKPGAARAQEMGVKSVPAVAVDGTLAACCQNQGISEEALREAGVGVPL